MNPINNRRAFLRSCAVLGAVGAAGILLPGCEKKDAGAGKSAAVIKGRADQVVDSSTRTTRHSIWSTSPIPSAISKAPAHGPSTSGASPHRRSFR